MKDLLNMKKIDYQIIDILRRDGRTTNTEIAQTLGITETTVSNHIKSLISNKIIKVMALIDPEKERNKFLATVCIALKGPEIEKKVIPKLLKLKGVNSVSLITGRHDLLIEVSLNSREEFVLFMTEELAKIGGISSTETFLLLKTFNKWI